MPDGALHLDGLRIAVCIEGGGSRSAYSAGMAMAVDELGLLREDVSSLSDQVTHLTSIVQALVEKGN